MNLMQTNQPNSTRLCHGLIPSSSSRLGKVAITSSSLKGCLVAWMAWGGYDLELENNLFDKKYINVLTGYHKHTENGTNFWETLTLVQYVTFSWEPPDKYKEGNVISVTASIHCLDLHIERRILRGGGVISSSWFHKRKYKEHWSFCDRRVTRTILGVNQ